MANIIITMKATTVIDYIVQRYAVRLHMRNIDIAKQWPDITCERNLGHNACAYNDFEADAVTFATRCLVTGCSLCVLISAIPQRTFNSGM